MFSLNYQLASPPFLECLNVNEWLPLIGIVFNFKDGNIRVFYRSDYSAYILAKKGDENKTWREIFPQQKLNKIRFWSFPPFPLSMTSHPSPSLLSQPFSLFFLLHAHIYLLPCAPPALLFTFIFSTEALLKTQFKASSACFTFRFFFPCSGGKLRSRSVKYFLFAQVAFKKYRNENIKSLHCQQILIIIFI